MVWVSGRWKSSLHLQESRNRNDKTAYWEKKRCGFFSLHLRREYHTVTGWKWIHHGQEDTFSSYSVFYCILYLVWFNFSKATYFKYVPGSSSRTSFVRVLKTTEPQVWFWTHWGTPSFDENLWLLLASPEACEAWHSWIEQQQQHKQDVRARHEMKLQHLRGRDRITEISPQGLRLQRQVLSESRWHWMKVISKNTAKPSNQQNIINIRKQSNQPKPVQNIKSKNESGQHTSRIQTSNKHFTKWAQYAHIFFSFNTLFNIY